jgi:hypothetical protein
MPLEVIGLPLPSRPIWLNPEGLQVPGWHTAVIVAEPGYRGVTEPAPPGINCCSVELYSSARPVMGLLLVSSTVAASARVLFTASETVVVLAG